MANEVVICGDILETILSHVPLLDLVSAADVSRSWTAAVASSLRHRNKPKPWLIVHTQPLSNLHAATAQAYDPRSQLWFGIRKPPVQYAAVLRSAHSGFLYMLSPSRFSFSSDPLSISWCHVEPPRMWRTDPIVARVGESVVVAGGACDFEDDPLAVEVFSLRSQSWRTCEPMPPVFKDSAASQWHSVAATEEKLVVTDNKSGLTHWFDPATNSWSGPVVLNPGLPVSHFSIGSAVGKLILVGICGIENSERVKIWRFDSEDLSENEEIGEMPPEYVDKLRSESFGIPSIRICAARNVVYVYNPSEAEELVVCELSHGGGCRWWSVRNVVAREDMVINQQVFSCSDVGIDELRRVMGGSVESIRPLPRRSFVNL